jgi:hypothetical protein
MFTNWILADFLSRSSRICPVELESFDFTLDKLARMCYNFTQANLGAPLHAAAATKHLHQ